MKERINLLRAMDTVARSCNNEELIMLWLSLGVADGDADLPDEDLETYVEDDDDFEEIKNLFLKIMSRAQEDGLYCR